MSPRRLIAGPVCWISSIACFSWGSVAQADPPPAQPQPLEIATGEPADPPPPEAPSHTTRPTHTPDNTDGPREETEPDEVVKPRTKAARERPRSNEISRSETVVGFRGARTSVSGGKSADGLALSAGMLGDLFVLENGQSGRVGIAMAFGGGTSGIEGNLGWLTTVGGRVDFGPRDGMFLRGGFHMAYDANKLLLTSNIQLPRGEFGYQHLGAGDVVEVGVQGGPSLVGRFNTEGFSRKLGESLEYGAFAHLAHGGFWADVNLTRFQLDSQDQPAPVDTLQGRLCAVIQHFSLCADARLWGTHVPAPLNSGARDINPRASFVGLQIGVGEIQTVR